MALALTSAFCLSAWNWKPLWHLCWRLAPFLLCALCLYAILLQLRERIINPSGILLCILWGLFVRRISRRTGFCGATGDRHFIYLHIYLAAVLAEGQRSAHL